MGPFSHFLSPLSGLVMQKAKRYFYSCFGLLLDRCGCIQPYPNWTFTICVLLAFFFNKQKYIYTLRGLLVKRKRFPHILPATAYVTDTPPKNQVCWVWVKLLEDVVQMYVVKLARDRKHVWKHPKWWWFCKGWSPLFHGNLGWWKIIPFGQIHDIFIYLHLVVKCR